MADKHHIDRLFRDAFEHFEQAPPEGLWSAISHSMISQPLTDSLKNLEELPSDSNWEVISDEIPSAEYFDGTIKNAFEEYEEQPHQGVWENIKKELPLNLWVKDSLNKLSKIAAALLIGFSLIYLLGQLGTLEEFRNVIDNKNHKEQADNYIGPKSERSETDDEEDRSSQDVIFNIEDKNIATEDINLAETSLTTNTETTEMESIDVMDSNKNSLEGADVESNTRTASDLIIPESRETQFDSNAEANSPIADEISESPGVVISEEITTNATESSSDESHSNENDESIIKSTEELGPEIAVSSLTASQAIQIGAPSGFEYSGEILDRLSPTDYKDLGQLAIKYHTHLSRPGDDLQTLKSFAFTGFYFSILTQVNSIWVISDEIRNEISSGNPVNHVLDIGASYGAGLGKQISPYLALEITWLHARNGQKYHELTSSGVYKTSELNQTYNYIPILLKFQAARLNSAGKFPMTWNYIGGVHYGRLQSAILKTGSETVSLTQNIITNEIGFDLGMEFHLFLDPKFFISLGGHTAFGFDTAQLTGRSTSKTTNINAGLQLGIHYR